MLKKWIRRKTQKVTEICIQAKETPKKGVRVTLDKLDLSLQTLHAYQQKGSLQKISSLSFSIEGKLKHLQIEEVEKNFSFTYIDHLYFQTPSILSWTLLRCQKTLKKKNYQLMNKWALTLFQHKEENRSNIYIQWINGFIGYGVFAAKNLSQYTYIGEYVGEIRKRNPKQDLLNNYIFRYVTGPKESPYVIDACHLGNFTRFMNHSDHPNITSRWIIANGVTHIVFFANKPIAKGEQLTYDYGPYYWRNRTEPIDL